MYISELKIQGFKSFAKKEKIKFGKGITVIVGPNGCGKTNIVDAIRWVLGEQKYSVLRSSKMGDVIFNGAEGVKPLSACEAFLTVQNNRGLLPVEYNDIEIGRRVFRDGESEYYINRTPCRLKDIHDLFIDTGMGSDAYSVIELKMIEQILSETADDRKRMFEEAAGINKYKQQRQSSLRKFDAVQKDLDRINDIILEVENNVHSLELHLKRFKRHEKLTIELKEKEIALSYLELHDLNTFLDPLREEVKKSREMSNQNSFDSSALLKALDNKKFIYKDQQDELNKLQSVISALEEDRETIQSDVLISSEKSNSASLNFERLKNEEMQNLEKNKELDVQILGYRNELDNIKPRINEKRDLYKKNRNDFDKVEQEYKKSQKNLDRVQTEKWDTKRRLEMDSSLIERTKELFEEKANLKKNLLLKINEGNEGLKKLRSDQKLFEKKQLDLMKKIEKFKIESEQIISSIKSNEEIKSKHSIQNISIKSQIESTINQIGFYEELLEQSEGYYEGTRYILNNKKDFPGVVGVLSDLFENNQKFEQAFISSLGDQIQYLIVEDKVIANNILKKAKSLKLGNIVMIPLKEIDKKTPIQKQAPILDGIIGSGFELCGISKKYKNIASYILGSLLIVDDIEKFVGNKDLKDWDIVDINGDYYGKNLLFKHHKKDRNEGMLARKKRIKDLKNNLSRLRPELEKKEIKIEKLDDAIKNEKIRLEQIIKKNEKLSISIQEIETSMIKNHYSQSQNLEIIKDSQIQINDTDKIISDSLASIDKMQESFKIATAKYDKVKIGVIEANTNMEESQKERDNFQQLVQEIRIDLINDENERDNIDYKIQIATNTIKELKGRNINISNEVNSIDTLKKELKISINEGNLNLNKISSKIAKDKSIFSLKKELANDTFQEMEDLQNKIQDEQRSRELLLEEMKKNELKIAEMDQKIIALRERIRDRYGVEIPNDLIVDEEKDDLEYRIERIEKSLESIGPINMAVKVEYEDEQSRLNMFSEQKDDLIKSEENLRATILKIDEIAREKFEKTFGEIKSNFASLFQMFFEGGDASLSLVGDPDPLESDIEISAQPPGKKNKGLRMLSAGEKSLTAIALLFAIYQYKPSPYCILDEVDAPLDDINVEKFKRVINQFSDDTQFIVVTHNKLTMESANYLYGVTMEQKGISKLVSVKFDTEA